MVEWINQTEGIWTYIVLFLLSAAPWLEVFLVVPLGIGLGLNTFAVAVTGFVGNWIPIILIGLFFKHIHMWLDRRKEKKRLKTAIHLGEVSGNLTSVEQAEPNSDEKAELHVAATTPTIEEDNKKSRRARGIWVKYGLPGLALLAPAIIGTDIAAILALAFGSPRRDVMIWMTISLIVWTIALTVGSVYGFSFVGMYS